MTETVDRMRGVYVWDKIVYSIETQDGGGYWWRVNVDRDNRDRDFEVRLWDSERLPCDINYCVRNVMKIHLEHLRCGTPHMFLLACTTNPEYLKYILINGAFDITELYYGKTCLMYAAECQPDVFRVLLTHPLAPEIILQKSTAELCVLNYASERSLQYFLDSDIPTDIKLEVMTKTDYNGKSVMDIMYQKFTENPSYDIYLLFDRFVVKNIAHETNMRVYWPTTFESRINAFKPQPSDV